jgi:hypothetical protein
MVIRRVQQILLEYVDNPAFHFPLHLGTDTILATIPRMT